MPWGLKRYQQTRQLHFVTFSCYHRRPLLADPQAHGMFVQTLETVRRWYGLWLIGYVVMPEHVHLLLSEPERKNLALVLQMLKQMVCRKLQPTSVGGPSYREAKGGAFDFFHHKRPAHPSQTSNRPSATMEIDL
jgi:REP element-mobilizing transposase RayT